jgi:hypothetical protein
MRKLLIGSLASALAALVAAALLAEPPVERTVVVAVADADEPRVLVRWRSVEGVKRYDYYDVFRRDADAGEFFQLNGDPIGPLTDVASIEAVFTAPGRADALGWIQDTLGESYASELLRLQGPDAPVHATAQLVFLPDQNYGAALALGLGWLDETVTMGETYVYEVWGVDNLGYPVERLGRASATAGAPGALSAPTGMSCVESGDQRAHEAAFLRWEDDNAGNDYFFGYEVVRVPKPVASTCPGDLLSEPGVVRATKYPVLPSSPGAVREGKALFEASCASCHTSRDDASLVDGTLAGFRMLQDPSIPGLDDYWHDWPELHALSSDSLKKIFDYVYEFQFRDDGDYMAVNEGETYCYQTVPRDLLGQLRSPGVAEPCAVRDLLPPKVPSGILSERIPADGTHEDCRISWDRNSEPDDDTANYEVLRRSGEVPRDEYLSIDGVDTIFLGMVIQPSGGPGDRVTLTDYGLTQADATHRFFYAVRAVDDSGNTSPLTGWVPCVPRDIVTPPTPTLERPLCCANSDLFCIDLYGGNMDPNWGDPTVIAGRDGCEPRLVVERDPDAFRYRLYRSFDGTTYYPAEDREPEDCDDPGYPNGSYGCLATSFGPSVDQKIWYKVRAIDKSGNVSGFSDPTDLLKLGAAVPPAPKITEVWIAPNDTDPHNPNGWIVVRFKALPPSALLGVSLYKYYSSPENPLAILGRGIFVTRFHDANLMPARPDPVNYPDKWGVLIYDPIEDQYEMWVDVSETEDIVLQLYAIGWTGFEGAQEAYRWSGYQARDDTLDWPEFRDRNYYVLSGDPEHVLTVTPGPGYNDLSWPYPEGENCASPTKSFVVFRQRNDSPHWKQISPLFTCFDPAFPVEYQDTDVEDGFCYRYVAVRLGLSGEFEYQYGPTAVLYPSGDPCP